MLNLFQKAQKKLENILNDKNIFNNINQVKPENNVMFISSKVALWKKTNYDDEFDYSLYFEKQFNGKYIVLNMTNNDLIKFQEQNKIINYKVPVYPAYTLQFILDFCLTIKEILENDKDLSLIFYDSILSVIF